MQKVLDAARRRRRADVAARSDDLRRGCAAGRGGLVTYVTAGDPDRADVGADPDRAVAQAGADVLEVGVPFSDPLADGPVIQRATERALAAGMTLRGTLDLVREVRRRSTRRSCSSPTRTRSCAWIRRCSRATAKDAGVDGVLILDYPVEEAEPLRAPLVDAGLDPIFLISPTTTDDAHPAVGRARPRVSLRDLAAGRDRRARPARGRRRRPGRRACARSRRCRSRSASASRRPSTSREACASADAAVVGSALVQRDCANTARAATWPSGPVSTCDG